VALHSDISEHEHEKGIPDGQANTATGAVQRGIEDGHHVDTGTRAHVLYLAQMHLSPRTPSAERVGLWAPGRYFYVYYDPSLWGEDKDFKMYKDAKKYHYRAGLAVEDEAVRSGLLKIQRRMCGCPPCSPPDFNFGQCMLTHVFGSVVSTHCPPKQKPRGALTQTQALVEFSESLVTNEVYAVKVAEDQTGVEGPYWLARLSTRSYQNEEEHVFAGDIIEAGFFVVKVRG
jgi:hypothetical protein